MEVEESATSSSTSALRENLERNGNNSYYYAHNKIIDGPAWDGLEEPRLLHSVDAGEKEAAATRIEKYAWCDEKKSVKVYIPFDGLEELPEDAVQFEWSERSFTLDIRKEGDVLRRLRVPCLSEEISSATLARKGGRIVLSLRKKEEGTWTELRQRGSSTF